MFVDASTRSRRQMLVVFVCRGSATGDSRENVSSRLGNVLRSSLSLHRLIDEVQMTGLEKIRF
jgi:hypothetical protein